MSKKISVVIPVYNVEKYIKQCLESVINQTHKNLEIIVVNDGTKDNSIKIVEEYLDDKRIKIINKENGGLSSARNKGLESVTGDYIHFLDSDDWIELTLYEKLVENIENEEIIIFNHAEFDEKISKIKNKKKIKLRKEFYFEKEGSKFLGNIPNGCWLKLYNSNYLKKNEFYFNEKLRLYEDLLWDIETLNLAKKVKFLDIVGYNYRLNRKDSLVNSKYDSEQIKVYKKFILEKLKYRINKILDEESNKKLKFFITKLEIEIGEKKEEYWNKYFLNDIKYFLENNMSILDRIFYIKEIKKIIEENYKRIKFNWIFLKYKVLSFKYVKRKMWY